MCCWEADSCSSTQVVVLLPNSSPSVLLPTVSRWTPSCNTKPIPHTITVFEIITKVLLPSITTFLPFTFSDKCHLLFTPHSMCSILNKLNLPSFRHRSNISIRIWNFAKFWNKIQPKVTYLLQIALINILIFPSESYTLSDIFRLNLKLLNSLRSGDNLEKAQFWSFRTQLCLTFCRRNFFNFSTPCI